MYRESKEKKKRFFCMVVVTQYNNTINTQNIKKREENNTILKMEKDSLLNILDKLKKVPIQVSIGLDLFKVVVEGASDAIVAKEHLD